MRIAVIEGSTKLFQDTAILGEGVEFGQEIETVLGDTSDDNPWGEPSAPLRGGKLANSEHELVVQSRHGAAHEFAPHAINYRANAWQLFSAEVDLVIGTYTVGGIDPSLEVGQLVAPTQLIDYTWGRESTFDDKLRHIDFSNPYHLEWRSRLIGVARSEHILVGDGGVYAATQGPRLETIAEVQRLARDGCTLVGMTGMPEAALCAELELPMVNLSVVVNPAAGVGAAQESIDMEDLYRASAAGALSIESLLAAFFKHL